MQVLLAIGARSAFVATAEEIPGGLAGPGHVEGTDLVPVPLGTPQTLRSLQQAIDNAITRARNNMGHCQGCRTYQAIFTTSERFRPYCRACMSRYFGLIID